MKSFLMLIITAFFFLPVVAQQSNIQSFKYTPGIGLEELRNGRWNKVLSDSMATRNSPTVYGKKPGVYHLPQDNMPCIVPDTTKLVNIPNVWKGSVTKPYKNSPPTVPDFRKRWVPTPITNTDTNGDTDTK